MKKSLIYFVALATVFSFLPVVNLNYASAQSCDPDALRPVSFGQRGPAVSNLQACLIEAGYDIPAISSGQTSYGYYGQQTADAVLNFYREAGIEAGVKLRGRSFGPQGIEAMKNVLVMGTEEETTTEETTEETTQTQTQQTQTNQLLTTLLPLLLQVMGVQLDATTSAQLMQALSNNDLTTAMSLLLQARQTTQTQQQTGGEGILIVEKNPTPASGLPLYEGQTTDWVGVRFRAQDSDITVGSFKLVYPKSNNSHPARVVSKFEVVDESGNVLKTINPSDFTQDYSTLDYYYYVTGLNYVVPRGGTRVLIVRATAVSTFPQGPNNNLELRVSDVRGRDASGIDRFPSTVVSNKVSRQTTLATAARFEVSRSSGSPVSKNVVADSSNGRIEKVPLLKVDLRAKNDRVQLTQLSGSSTASGVSVDTVYLMDGNQILDSATVESGSYTFSNLLNQNIRVERDTTKTLTIAADISGATTSQGTVSATVSSVSSQNSLGDTRTDPVSGVSGDTLYVFTEAPHFAKSSTTFNVAVTRDQNNSTTTANATLEILITAEGGPIKISSTTVFTLFRETSAGATSSVSKAVSSVYDSSGREITGQLSGGFYVIPANQTYKFVLQDSHTYAGAARIRYKVDDITWRNSANTDITSTWVDRDLTTDWSN
ncbi:MAG: hypothetical protein KatS3mg095_0178 [Candidatus Parcubacteria bacterium]|nr:MAG: hypothetical protein KatS3mg095_0178 [Candidatus Parcubacteria bacterium]